MRISSCLKILSGYHYEIVYIRGDEHLVEDAPTHILVNPDITQAKLPCEKWRLPLELTRQITPNRCTRPWADCGDGLATGCVPVPVGGWKARLRGCARDISRADVCDQGSRSLIHSQIGLGSRGCGLAAAGCTQVGASDFGGADGESVQSIESKLSVGAHRPAVVRATQA